MNLNVRFDADLSLIGYALIKLMDKGEVVFDYDLVECDIESVLAGIEDNLNSHQVTYEIKHKAHLKMVRVKVLP